MSICRNAVRAGLVTVTAAGLLLIAESGPVGTRHANASAAEGVGAGTSRQVATVAPVQVRSFAYASRDDRQQIVATWHPSMRRAPWVATIHGGSWVKGGPSDVSDAVDLFSRHGYQVFNIGYRLVDPRVPVSPVRWSDQRDDVRTALAWIRSHAAGFGIDPNRGALFGSSAGGNLALAAGLAGDGHNGIRGIVSVSGVVQPTRLWDDVLRRNKGERATAAMRRLAEFAERAAGCAYPRTPLPDACRSRWRAMDAMSAVSPHDPAVLLYQGLADRTVPYQMAQAFRAQLDRADIAGSLVLVRGLGHTQQVALDGGARQDAMLAFVAARTGVATAPALSRLAVTHRSAGTKTGARLTVRVQPRRAGVPVTGFVVASAGHSSIKAKLAKGSATISLPRKAARTGAVAIRYEGSPVLQPRTATVTLPRKKS